MQKLSKTPKTPGARYAMAAMATLAAAGAMTLWVSSDANGADHQEAGTIAGADPAADIGDLYVWHDDDKVRVALTFAGYRLRTENPVYDADVLYQVHFDTDADNEADISVGARFGQDSLGEWGVQFESLPGSTEPLSGPIGEILSAGSAQATAGHFDDPFFFDLQGFQDTLATGTLAFDATRDFVAVKNTSAIVFEFDAAELGATTFQAWATTGRR